MRKEYGKALRACFAKKMKSSIPEYVEEKVKSRYISPGERGFRKKFNESLHCWIVLAPSLQGYDEFTVMVGWSNFGRYPELRGIPSWIVPSASRAEFAEAEYLTRLPMLHRGRDDWWVVKPFRTFGSVEEIVEEITASMAPVPGMEAEALVQPLVDDAVNKLIKIGLPYLEEYVLSRQ